MKRIFSLALVLVAALQFSSCKKDQIPFNQVPLVDAGPAKFITLTKADTTTLSGWAKDPDGQVVAYLWSQVSGPSTVEFADAGAAKTLVSGLQAGVYVFQLMATDNEGATGVDTVSVTVKAPTVKTFIASPSNNPNELAIGVNNGKPETFSSPEISLLGWTIMGYIYNGREVLKFDLSSIPKTANILTANLYLYTDSMPLNGNFIDANFGADNSFIVQQITSSWTPTTINWFNQPSVTTTGQVNVPTTTQSFLDLNLNVKAMVNSMVNNAANYGFAIKLNKEVLYTSRVFISSFNPDKVSRHPKLVITYN